MLSIFLNWINFSYVPVKLQSYDFLREQLGFIVKIVKWSFGMLFYPRDSFCYNPS